MTPATSAKTARAFFDREDGLALAAIVAGSGTLAWYTIAHLIQRVGHPGGTLDDSYIHFQYARAIAEGHPLRYTPGAPHSSGGTSFVWPLALALPYALGLRGESILWAAWAFSFASLAALAWEARALTRRIAGDVAANGAAALILVFPAFTWFAVSGMEVVPFAWLLAHAVRRGAEWSEGAQSRTREWELLAMAWVLPLFRPEGAVITLALAATRFAIPSNGQTRRQAIGPALALATGALLPTLLLLATTGQPTSSTAQVKLLSWNPYLSSRQLVDAIWTNVCQLFSSLLNGGEWSKEFIPPGSVGVAIAGLISVLLLSNRTKSRARGVLILALAACILIPCVYFTFLWNRLRYLWPFATPWVLGLSCLARVFGESFASFARSDRLRTSLANAFTAVPLLAAGVVLLRKIPDVTGDVASCASAIDRQQVSLGYWAKEHLDSNATVGVNDTGAIAYFGGVRTFDIVGLTTPGEARYWVAGAASRFEHYEHLFKEDPARLPTHYAVYPAWFDCVPMRGAELTSRTVNDSTILGGDTMVVYQADNSTLGSGELPWSSADGRVVDHVDVADLDDEAAHAYDLAHTPDELETIYDSLSSASTFASTGVDNERPPKRVVDGGRLERSVERFTAKLEGACRGIARLDAAGPSHAVVSIDGAVVAEFVVLPGGWREYDYRFPPSSRDRAQVVVTFEPPVTAYHHWFVHCAQ